ncbi:hypothetical protein ACFV9D_27425 [Streptomyces sp. NPDC059875]|uniref:hypothetical protein n=1 Tax=unclassified Streptomyces TaxID=2593676 RepID=UPI0036596CB3
MSDVNRDICYVWIKDGDDWAATFVIDGRRYADDPDAVRRLSEEAFSELNRLRIPAEFETTEVSPTQPASRLPSWEEYRRRLPPDDSGRPAAAGVDRITYYARVNESCTKEDPHGVVRRIHSTPPVDQVFARDMRWRPTEFLHLHRLGHDDYDPVEITATEAAVIIGRWKAKRRADADAEAAAPVGNLADETPKFLG